MRRVVVTGMGIVSPIGTNINENLENLKKGYCGIDYITAFDSSDIAVKVAGQIKNLNLEEYFEKKEIKRMDRFVALALIAANEAAKMSGFFENEFNNDRAGVIVGTGTGGLNFIEQEHEKMLTKGTKYISPFFVPGGISNIAAAMISIKYKMQDVSYCIETACAAGTTAIGEAFRRIRDGYSDLMICGGTESCISKFGICSFDAIRALSHSDNPATASIPFDKDRNGFVMGEGAGMLVLEDYDSAIKRNAHIICEISGYGSNCDAFHVTAPRNDGLLQSKCMEEAINDAKANIEDINYINAHGTSTHMNDKCETLAIHNLFKENTQNIYVSSTKSMTGHLLGGSGAIEAVFTALAVNNDFIPPNIGLNNKDPECDLNIPVKCVDTTVNYALTNSFGFGGHNATLLFKKYI